MMVIFRLKLCRRHLNASTTHMQTDWWWQWISLNTFTKKTLKINRFNVYGYKDTLFPYAWISGVCWLNHASEWQTMHFEDKRKWCQNFIFIDCNFTSIRKRRQKRRQKNTPAKTIEQTAPNVWAHFTKYVHTYLTIFDIHIWINSMRYVRHWNGSVSVIINFGLKLLSSSPEILCYAYSSFRSTLDSWILLSLDFDNSCLLKQLHHAQFPKRSKWQLVDERFIYSSRSFVWYNW